MPYLRYLCLFEHSVDPHILLCVSVLFFFVLCTLSCQFLLIVHFVLPLGCSLAFIYIIYNDMVLFIVSCLTLSSI